MSDALPADPRVDAILDLIATQTRIDRRLLVLEARADEIGLSSLDMALAMFEIEDHYDIDLPEASPDSGAAPTVGELVRLVLSCIDRKEALSSPAA